MSGLTSLLSVLPILFKEGNLKDIYEVTGLSLPSLSKKLKNLRREGIVHGPYIPSLTGLGLGLSVSRRRKDEDVIAGCRTNEGMIFIVAVPPDKANLFELIYYTPYGGGIKRRISLEPNYKTDIDFQDFILLKAAMVHGIIDRESLSYMTPNIERRIARLRKENLLQKRWIITGNKTLEHGLIITSDEPFFLSPFSISLVTMEKVITIAPPDAFPHLEKDGWYRVEVIKSIVYPNLGVTYTRWRELVGKENSD